MTAPAKTNESVPTVGLKAQLTRGVLPWWLLRTNEMLMMEVRQIKPLPRPLENIEVRWGCREDEPLLQQVRHRAKPYTRHFDDGSLCVIGFVDGKPASYCWFETSGLHISRTNGYKFRYGPDAAWVFGFEIHPDYRISGIFHKHWKVSMELLAGRGVNRVFGSIQADNPHSLQSHRRLGFNVLCRYKMARVCGLIRYIVTPENGSGIVASTGVQAWQVRIL